MKKFRVLSLIFSVAAIAAFLIACSNPAGPGGNTLGNTGQTGGDNSQTTTYVYAAGFVNSNAMVWRNGEVLFNLGNGGALCVFVSGNDVYVAGWSWTSPGNSTAVIWKNGVIYQTLGTGTARAVVVSGNNVFAAGNCADSNAIVWKNGSVLYNLGPGWASSMYVSGTDVFVSGNSSVYVSGNNVNYGRIWKNGNVIHELGAAADVRSVFVSGNNVFAAGTIGGNPPIATLWTNGIPQAQCTVFSFAHSVFVSGNDVFVTGVRVTSYTPSGEGWGAVWKNNELYQVMPGGHFFSVFASGGNVFAAGLDNHNGHAATVWNNGTVEHLNPNEIGEAHSVFVVER